MCNKHCTCYAYARASFVLALALEGLADTPACGLCRIPHYACFLLLLLLLLLLLCR
jgi:hypothetical protein